MPVQRILLAHENADCRRIFGSALTYEGYAVAEVTGCELALETLRSNHFDLVVSDLYLRSTGDECLVRRIRGEPALAALPVIVLSGWSTDPHRRLAMDEGADAFFPLPVSPRELMTVVHDLLAPRVPPRNGYHTTIAGSKEERAPL